MKLALKITPQRSTQYANMTETLAAPELLASPLGPAVTQIEPTKLAGQDYLLVTFDEQKTSLALPDMLPILSRLGATSEIYEYFEQIGETPGPFLRPLSPQFVPFVPLEMA